MAEKLGAIYSSSLWLHDLDRITESLPELSELNGKSVLITGTNGLICSAITDVLIRYNETHSGNIHIIAAGRDPQRVRTRFGEFCDKDYFTFMQYNALTLKPELPKFSADYIIHGAGNAHPAAMAAEPVNTMLSNIFGVNVLLNAARYGTKRLLYISSSEVYGKRTDGNFQPFTEDDYGYVDILNSRSCYPMGKRSAETLCVNYAVQYGVDDVIVRPGHVYGPTASVNDSRVSSAFAYNAARGEKIIMKSAGLQLRSWCYCVDCASAILKVLLCGKSANAYNIPGEILTIREMSEKLAEFGGVELVCEEASESERKAFNPMNNSSLDGSKLEAFGWRNIFDADTGLKHTVEILKSIV